MSEPRRAGFRDRLLALGVGIVLLLAALNVANGSPAALTSGFQAMAFVVFAALAVLIEFPEREDWRTWLAQVFFSGSLLGFVLLVRGDGIPTAWRGLQITLLLVFLAVFPFVRRDGLGRIVRAGPFVLAAVVVVGAHFYHAVGYPPGSGRAAFPLVVGVILFLNLFFVPQHVSRDGFFWATSRVCALLVGLGLLAYFVGPYSVLGFRVEYWPESIVAGIPVLRSVFGNPNTLGLVAFAGAVTALVETWETYDSDDDGRWWVVPAAVLGVNGLGLFLSFSRASWLAGGLALGVYATVHVGTRSDLPRTTVGLMGAMGVFLAAVGTGVLPINPGKRFGLWAGAVETFLADPTILGEGIVVPERLMRPHVGPEYAGDGPHNSYLMILLRAGIGGLIGYLVLTVGSVGLGLVERQSVDVGVLALSTGWLVHQLFESYTLFQYTPGAVFASLAFGYLVVDLTRDRSNAGPEGRVRDQSGGDRSLRNVFFD